MSMACSRKIQITVISAENLLGNHRQPAKIRNAFVIIKTDTINSISTSMNVENQGTSNPAWNQKLVMDLPETAHFLTVEIYSGSKVIGKVNIPVSDFLGGYLPENYLSLLSYRLRDSNGEKNGVINLSVKVMNEGGGNRNGCASNSSRPWMGVSVDDHDEVFASGVVTGVPVVPYRY